MSDFSDFFNFLKAKDFSDFLPKKAPNYYEPLFLKEDGYIYKLISDDNFIEIKTIFGEMSYRTMQNKGASEPLLQDYNDGILDKITREDFEEIQKATLSKLIDNAY